MSNESISLVGKWLPSEGKAEHEMARKVKNHLNLNWRDYRKLLSSLRDEIGVVEQKMCNNNWKSIEYSEVPSQAINIYRDAFQRHDPKGFSNWIDKLEDSSSDEEINAGAIYPHEIVSKFFKTHGWGGGLVEPDESTDMLEAQWNELPDYLSGSNSIVPVCDVSGSMTNDVAINVSIALGLYISERNEGPFEDLVMTFSGDPHFVEITSSGLRDRIQELHGIDWDSNTNIEKMIQSILDVGVTANLPEEEMPETLLILSDMQFDTCTRSPSDTAMEMIEREYNEEGYDVPQIVFWNLRDSRGNPVKFNDDGVALVSGFSPSILERVLDNTNMTPWNVMMDTITDERYDVVTV